MWLLTSAGANIEDPGEIIADWRQDELVVQENGEVVVG